MKSLTESLTEQVKSFLASTYKEPEGSSKVEPEQVLQDFDGSDIYNTGAFFDDNTGIFSSTEKESILEKQKQKIMTYRNIAKVPDVNNAIDEIVNETGFSLRDDEPLTLEVNEENDKIKNKITDSFEKINNLLNLNKNLYNLIKNTYIDGQLIIHCAYDDNTTKNGIQSLKLIEPVYFYFDIKSNVYKYQTKQNKDFFRQTNIGKTLEYSPEEIIKVDFGLKESSINLSYLEYALKPANQLKTLEDLLIPMRFSRSISRRVFNVDIGDLPNKKGEQAMREMQHKFKYKKFYNVETGEVTNQQHITSMVEDYWFANRSGGKGTQVDTLDETGNLGELNDILYFSKKLYKAMKIPSNRINNNPDEDSSFDYDSTQVTKEDIKFFMFISRIRKVYITLFKELLKRELISTKVMSEEEFETYKSKINIYFTAENAFIEKMNLDNFTTKLDIYATAQEYAGKLFPVEKILKEIFRMSDEEIEENFKKIEAETKNPKYSKWYSDDGEESW